MTQKSIIRLKGHGGDLCRYWWVSRSFVDLEGDKIRAQGMIPF